MAPLHPQGVQNVSVAPARCNSWNVPSLDVLKNVFDEVIRVLSPPAPKEDKEEVYLPVCNAFVNSHDSGVYRTYKVSVKETHCHSHSIVQIHQPHTLTRD
jgi:hypothetical protein